MAKEVHGVFAPIARNDGRLMLTGGAGFCRMSNRVISAVDYSNGVKAVRLPDLIIQLL
jgi:hypothetical protein